MQMGRSAARLAVLCCLFANAWVAEASADKIEPALLSAAQAAGPVDFVIQMQAAADLSAADAQKTRADRGRVVVAALKATAAASQSGVRAELAARQLPHRAFWIANVITARGSLADLQALAARSDVRQLLQVSTEINALSPYIARRQAAVTAASAQSDRNEYVAKALGDPEPGIALVNAPAVWALGFTGQGVVVGDHDIGVEWTHPALKKKYRGWDEATQTASHAFNWRNAFGAADLFCEDPAVPCDPNQHGTHTTGTMVGDDGEGNKIGMAPGAKWMACRSLLDPVAGVGTVPTYLDCMEWQIAPYPEGQAAAADPAMAPDVVNNSWGCLEACAPPVLEDVNEAIKAAGIVQVVSAGNDGSQCSTIAFPLAVYESSFTVGASNVMDAMAGFSSRGPVASDGSMRLKPNITAPGVATRSSVPGGGYGNLSGTSMAGPHVAGLVALVMSAEPRLKGRVDDVRKLVELSAVQTITTVQTCGGTPVSMVPNNTSGWGRIDALNAVTMRPQLAVKITAPPTVKTGEIFSVLVEVSQPATGKIEASNVLYDVAISGAKVVADCSGCSANPKESDTTFKGEALAIAPGQSDTIELILRGDATGELSVTATAEADQVSPTAPVSAKTMIAAPTTPALPTTPVASVSSEAGRFGGSLGSVLMGLAAFAAVRRKLRR